MSLSPSTLIALEEHGFVMNNEETHLKKAFDSGVVYIDVRRENEINVFFLYARVNIQSSGIKIISRITKNKLLSNIERFISVIYDFIDNKEVLTMFLDIVPQFVYFQSKNPDIFISEEDFFHDGHINLFFEEYQLVLNFTDEGLLIYTNLSKKKQKKKK